MWYYNVLHDVLGQAWTGPFLMTGAARLLGDRLVISAVGQSLGSTGSTALNHGAMSHQIGMTMLDVDIEYV
jgi:hypothetical protein